MIQHIIVAIIVILCVLYILRKFVFKAKSRNACDGCDRCSNKNDGCH